MAHLGLQTIVGTVRNVSLCNFYVLGRKLKDIRHKMCLCLSFQEKTDSAR